MGLMQCDVHGLQWLKVTCPHVQVSFANDVWCHVEPRVDEVGAPWLACSSCLEWQGTSVECSECVYEWAERRLARDLRRELCRNALRRSAVAMRDALEGPVEAWRRAARDIGVLNEGAVLLSLVKRSLVVQGSFVGVAVELRAPRQFERLLELIAAEPRVDPLRRERRNGDVRLVVDDRMYALAWRISETRVALETPHQHFLPGSDLGEPGRRPAR
ncbi:MAG: hypothetical protein QM817_34380 [Archangium sp.]